MSKATGDLGVTLDSADLFGMKLGAATLAARLKKGETTIDPIVTTLNGGRLRVEPAFRRGTESTPAILLLKRGTTLRDATVNDEVSTRVLWFVAPLLNDATRVNGRISATIDQAVIPLGGDGKEAKVTGEVVFQDVRFLPGGLFRDLFARFGREEQALITLDRPVALEIADRRVYQRGLVIPVGKLTRFEMDGWVGFDKTLHLTVGLPVLPTALTDLPGLGGLAANTRVRVPIRGTMDHPVIDTEAFKAGMKEMTDSVFGGALPSGMTDLFKRFQRPRAPDAPRPLTPRERRMQRRLNRDPPE